MLAAIDQVEFAALGLDLGQQTFTKVAGGDAYRIELADDGEARLEMGFRTVKHGLRQLRESCVDGAAGGLVLSVAGVRLSVGFVVCLMIRVLICVGDGFRHELLAEIAGEKLFIAGGEIAILVEVADDIFSSVAHGGGERHRAQLPEDVVGQRARLGEEVFERGRFDGLEVVAGAVAGVEVVLKIRPEVDFFEGIGLLFRFGFGGTHLDGAVVLDFLAGDVVEQRDILLDLLEDGVLGDLGVDHFLQLKLVERQDADHLHEAGRQYLALSYSQAQLGLK